MINACVGYDKTHKANLGKGSNIYTTFTQNVENTPGKFSPDNSWESSCQGIDTPNNEFYNVNSTTAHYPGPPRPKNLPRMPPNTPNQSMNPIMNPHHKPQKRQWDGPIYLPKSIYVLMSEQSKEALKNITWKLSKSLKIGQLKRLNVVMMTPLLIQVQNQKINPFRSTQIMISRHLMMQYLISSTTRLPMMSNWSKHSNLTKC